MLHVSGSIFIVMPNEGLIKEDNILMYTYVIFLCFVDRASLYNLFQMKPTWFTLLLSIFISTSVHVSGN